MFKESSCIYPMFFILINKMYHCIKKEKKENLYSVFVSVLAAIPLAAANAAIVFLIHLSDLIICCLRNRQ